MISRHRSIGPAALLCLIVMVACGGCSRDEPSGEGGEAHVDSIRYVGRDACAECHEAATAAWTGSHHDLAMANAADETVLGDFDEASFTECGVTTRFYRDGERFLISTGGPGGEIDTFEVSYTFGVDPLQQYLISMPEGRYQSFTVAWDTDAGRWFSLHPEECVSADDPLHWTAPAMNWNYMCADCHSTNLQRNFQLESNVYETTFSEVDVSCEACHGPGGEHVEWADGGRRSGENRGRESHNTAFRDTYGFAVDQSSQRQQVESCAPCHSRRRTVYPDFRPGKNYLDHYEPDILQDHLYYADGQIRDEVYVYGSFLQSTMYREGVRCTDCHDPHSTDVKIDGNGLCTQCHEPDPYDTFEHIRHDPSSAGSQCVDCHMPERTYMVVDPRRDHSFTIPRPDLTAELDVPNACTGCHDGETPEWAAERIVDWHGSERSGDANAVRAIADGREQHPAAEQDLIRLAQNGDKAGIVRATAMFLLQGYESAASFDAARAALWDSEPLVRLNAIRKLEGASESDRITALSPLVEDSVRLVRMEAARVLAQTSASRFAETPKTDRAGGFWDALEEYRTGQFALRDQAAAHLNLATIHEVLDEAHDAEQAYRAAIRLDSSFVPAHLNLAMLYNRMRTDLPSDERRSDSLYRAAESELRRAIRIEPDMPEIHYTLGLLLAEREDGLADAVTHLTRAAELAPRDARIHYNAGLALQHAGRRDEAEAFLRSAHDLEPGDSDYLNALSIFYAQAERWAEALDFTEQLSERVGPNEAIQQRLAYIRSQMGR